MKSEVRYVMRSVPSTLHWHDAIASLMDCKCGNGLRGAAHPECCWQWLPGHEGGPRMFTLADLGEPTMPNAMIEMFCLGFFGWSMDVEGRVTASQTRWVNGEWVEYSWDATEQMMPMVEALFGPVMKHVGIWPGPEGGDEVERLSDSLDDGPWV